MCERDAMKAASLHHHNKSAIRFLCLFLLLPFPSPPFKASAVLPPSSSLQSLVPSSSLPPSLWCHGSLAPGGEGRREEGMLGRRDGRREEGRGCMGCCHLFPCSCHHRADKQSKYECTSPGLGGKLLVAFRWEATGCWGWCGEQEVTENNIFLGKKYSVFTTKVLQSVVFHCVRQWFHSHSRTPTSGSRRVKVMRVSYQRSSADKRTITIESDGRASSLWLEILD